MPGVGFSEMIKAWDEVIMDPTANPSGQINTPSALDLIVFDAIGWDLVPEPSSALLGALGGLLAVMRRRR